jgi:hypothetical protein
MLSLTNNSASAPKVAFILCGALAREVIAITKRYGWDVELFGVAASDHMRPILIAPDVERRLRELIPRFARVVVLYGDCGTSGRLDEVLARYHVPRIAGPHCYEMYGGAAFDAQMDRDPSAFFLTDFLVRGFEGTIAKGLGLDRYPELRDAYFANYNRLVYMVQQEDAALIAKAHMIAARLGLPLELQRTGYGQLEQRLVELMAEIYEPRYAPVLADPIEQVAAPRTPEARRRRGAARKRDRTDR